MSSLNIIGEGVTGRRCPNFLRTADGGLRRCTGTMREWRGTDGHCGTETFETCRVCGYQV